MSGFHKLGHINFVNTFIAQMNKLCVNDLTWRSSGSCGGRNRLRWKPYLDHKSNLYCMYHKPHTNTSAIIID